MKLTIEDSARTDIAQAIRNPGSYRDPNGFVFCRHGSVLRQVNRCYRADYDQLMASGLYEELVADRLLLSHQEAPLDWGLTSEAYKVLRPTQLPLVAYPYEWCFSQWQDAALLTLELQRRAMRKGMTLKDASAYNVQLHEGRLVLIDTLSLERYEPGRPWVAYRQFCQHFLAPLALMSKTDLRLGQLLRVYLDGVPLDLASRLLPGRSKFSLSLGLHVHAHAKTLRKYAGAAAPMAKVPQFSQRNFEALVGSLQAAVAGLRCDTANSQWSDYYLSNNNYGEAGLAAKERLVRQFLGKVQPQTVWDLGANSGRFSRLAVECGAVLAAAWDNDPVCVEQNYRAMKERGETAIYPLLVDLTNPSPGIGWANTERLAFGQRGPADLLLALGLVHHLAIGNNLPLEKIAEHLAGLGRWLILEWIPKADSQVQKLLAARQDVFAGYEQSAFEASFQRYFTTVQMEAVGQTQRTLYLLRSVHH